MPSTSRIEPASRRERTLLALGAIVLAGLQLALHLPGLDSSLPHAPETDTPLVRQSLAIRKEATIHWIVWAMYPHAVSLAMAAVPRDAELDPPAEKATRQTELSAHLEFAGRHFRAGRLTVMSIAVLAFLGTYLLSRRFLPVAPSVLAVAFCAGSLLLQSYAHQARPHAPLAATALLALLACAHFVRSGTNAALVGASCACAIALGTLHNGSFVLVGAAVAWLLYSRNQPLREQRRLLVPIAVLVVGLACFYPWFFAGRPAEAIGEGTVLFPQQVDRGGFDFSGTRIVWSALTGYEPVLCVLAAIGIAAGASQLARRRASPGVRVELAVHASALLAYLAVLCAYSGTFPRFATPFVPYLAVLAAGGLWFLARVAERAIGRRPAQFAAAAVALLAFFLHARPTVHLAWLWTRPDVQTAAAVWILDLPPRKTVVVTPRIDLPLVRPVPHDDDHSDEHMPSFHPWSGYLNDLEPGTLRKPAVSAPAFGTSGYRPRGMEAVPRSSPDVRELLRELRADYVLIEPGNDFARGLNRIARADGELVARFTPWSPGDPPRGETEREAGFTYEGGDYRSDVLAMQRLGPVLEMYRLRRQKRR